ncbi:chorismate synthase [Streptomyces colonosanans]|uniref:Chorismate synthase n=1 Tax=Streptomyces colonosanans TaxID=1428652 RepID=A0A1S2P461_9ACTN|nr:chorismate synthase [Streptomyces colonosanans]OIJ87844.1 chorismate synthase [Streptomyces colonosanans]
MAAETDLSPVQERAARLADEAARAAGVHLRTVRDVTGIAAVADFFSDVWRTPRQAPPLPAEELHSLVHAGGAVHAAYTADGDRLAGACVAVFGPPAAAAAYSLVAAADHGVGYAVKQAQRAWALEHGARTLRWTFDPLVARNARFNLVKLGATGTEYLVDFYGPMADGVNDGDESDRLTVTWDLTAPRRPYGSGDRAAASVTVPWGGAGGTSLAPDGAPLALRARDGRQVWCRVPGDIVALRATDPALALRWRRAVRDVFTEAFAEGFRATDMSRDGWYTLTLAVGTSASSRQLCTGADRRPPEGDVFALD